jgi:hypothetical protein
MEQISRSAFFIGKSWGFNHLATGFLFKAQRCWESPGFVGTDLGEAGAEFCRWMTGVGSFLW